MEQKVNRVAIRGAIATIMQRKGKERKVKENKGKNILERVCVDYKNSFYF